MKGSRSAYASNGETREMTLAEFLPGVLAARCPPPFRTEALRAQAIAARSYIAYRAAPHTADGVHDDAERVHRSPD
jgi:stage II sporulation protein D